MAAPVTAVRLVYGGALLAAPARVLSAAGLRDDRHARAFARLLGARHGAEALLALAGGRSLGKVGAAVDTVHAATALAWAAYDRGHRRALLLNALAAGAFALSG